MALNLGYKIPNIILQISLFILLNDDWQTGVDIVQAGGSGVGGKIYSFLMKMGKIY